MTPESRRALRDLKETAEALKAGILTASATLERVVEQIVKAEAPISYTVPEAARVTGKSPFALRRACRTGELAATMIDRSYYILAEDLRAYMGQRAQTCQ